MESRFHIKHPYHICTHTHTHTHTKGHKGTLEGVDVSISFSVLMVFMSVCISKLIKLCTYICVYMYIYTYIFMGFPGGLVVMNLPTNAWDTKRPWVWSLGLQDPMEKEMATHPSIFCLEHSIDRRDWWDTIHGVSKSQTQLTIHTHTHTHIKYL